MSTKKDGRRGRSVKMPHDTEVIRAFTSGEIKTVPQFRSWLESQGIFYSKDGAYKYVDMLEKKHGIILRDHRGKRGRPHQLPQEARVEVWRRANEEGEATTSLRRFIGDKYGVDYSDGGVYMLRLRLAVGQLPPGEAQKLYAEFAPLGFPEDEMRAAIQARYGVKYGEHGIRILIVALKKFHAPQAQAKKNGHKGEQKAAAEARAA